MTTVTLERGYHCSPNASLVPTASLCVADDRNLAAMYLRGGDITHYLYTFTWLASDITVADERALIETWERLTGRTHDEGEVATWRVAKNKKVRAALLAEGYDAISYGDTHAGCNYETTEFLRLPASLHIESTEVIPYVSE